MPSTGSWLDEIQDYTSLKNGDAKVAPVLYVTDKENVRKSPSSRQSLYADFRRDIGKDTVP
jgi:hypothetical protein